MYLGEHPTEQGPSREDQKIGWMTNVEQILQCELEGETEILEEIMSEGQLVYQKYLCFLFLKIEDENIVEKA